MAAQSTLIPFAHARITAIRSTATDADRMVARGSFAAALVACAPDLPLLAALGSVFTDLVPKGTALVGSWPTGGLAAHAPLGGALFGLGAWLVLAILYRYWGCTDAAGANAHSFGQLYERLEGLRTWRAVLEPHATAALSGTDAPPLASQATTGAGLDRVQSAALEVCRYTDAIEHELCRRPPGLRWLLATGYVSLWNLVHRAEEALIEAEPASAVLGDALYDDLRLLNAPMGNSTVLSAQLRRAIGVVQSGAQQYLQPASLDCPGGAGTAADPAVLTSAACGVVLGAEEARAVLRGIRRAINEFRDGRRDGLVHARNCLLMTKFLTALVSYLLLVLAVCNNTPPQALSAAVALFLVGALVGLFNRLYVDAHADAAVEDYGLSRARLMQTPVLSGLAAVGGVLITTMLTGTASAAPQQLHAVSTLTANPSDLLIAALFGLTPHLLISRLSSQAEQFKSDLKGTAVVSATGT